MIKRIVRKLIRRIRGGLSIEELISRGLVIGENVNIIGDEVILDPNHCWLIEIGDEVVIAPRVHILCHDASSVHGKATKIGRVKIGKRTFIGANAIILPGVTIGENVIIGAGSVVTHDIPDGVIAAGNPARIIGDRTENENRHMQNLSIKPTFPWPQWGVEGGITGEQKEKMKEALKNTTGYLINK